MAKVYRFQYEGHWDDGVQVITGLHYQTDVPPLGSEPNAADLLAGIDGHLRTAFLAMHHSSFVVDSAELREEVDPASGAVPAAASLAVNTGGVFSGGTIALPDALCAIIKLRTDAALRSARGYMAITSPRQTANLSTSRQWTGTFLTALQNFAALLDDDISAGSFAPTVLHPVVYSRTRRGLQLSPYTFKIVEGIVRTVPSWRRSRMTAP